jgi:hypothetical protein
VSCRLWSTHWILKRTSLRGEVNPFPEIFFLYRPYAPAAAMRQQSEHQRPPPARLDPREAARDPAHEVTEHRLPPFSVYAVTLRPLIDHSLSSQTTMITGAHARAPTGHDLDPRQGAYRPEPDAGEAHMSEYALDEREAFLVMSRFVWQFANRAGDDLLTLLGDISLREDGGPTDPAAWTDWMACVRSVVDGTEDPAGGSAGTRLPSGQ